MRGNVRRDGGALDADVRTKIRPGRVNRAAREDDRRQSTVRAAINHKLDLLRQKFSIFADGGFVSRVGRMTLSCRRHVFGAIVDHFHGLAGLPGQQRGMTGDHRRVFFLAPEAAASLSLNHANFFFRQIE